MCTNPRLGNVTACRWIIECFRREIISWDQFNVCHCTFVFHRVNRISTNLFIMATRCERNANAVKNCWRFGRRAKSYRAYLYRTWKERRKRRTSEKRKEWKRETEREREGEGENIDSEEGGRSGVTSSGSWQLRELFQFISSPEASFSSPISSRTFLFFLPFTSLSLCISASRRSLAAVLRRYLLKHCHVA